MSDPRLHILIARKAPYAHVISDSFFFLLKPNWLNSQPQSKSSTASKVVRGHLEALIMTHSSRRVLQHYNVVIAAEDVFIIKV